MNARRRHRRRADATWIAAVGLLVACAVAATDASARVVLVGVDGAAWNVVDPMIAGGELPNLAAIARDGVTAELETVEPLTSPVVWTSIATGRAPDAHGVTDFYSTALSIRVPTVFERLAARGLRVGLYDYLMTWPPATLPDGFVVPGWLRRDDSVTPPDAWSRVDLEPWANAYDALKTSEDYRLNAMREVASKAERWNALATAFDVEVGAVTFYAVDGMSHRFWHGAFPEAFSPDVAATATPAQRTALRDALRGVDRQIGLIRSRLGAGDAILVASDHGFRAREEPSDVWVGHFAEALSRAGLDPACDGFAVLSEFGQLIVRVAPGPFDEADETTRRIAALVESHTTEDGTGLFWAAEVLDVAPRPAGRERSVWNRLRQWTVRWILEHVYDAKIESNAHAVVLAVPRAGALAALSAEDPVRVDGRTLPRERVFSRQVFTGEHDPVAIFLAAGGPIAHVAERGRISVLDVAPLVLYVAGAPVPDDLEGRVPAEWIRPDALASNPIGVVPAGDMPGVRRGTGDGDGADPALVEKLRRLGYVE